MFNWEYECGCLENLRVFWRMYKTNTVVLMIKVIPLKSFIKTEFWLLHQEKKVIWANFAPFDDWGSKLHLWPLKPIPTQVLRNDFWLLHFQRILLFLFAYVLALLSNLSAFSKDSGWIDNPKTQRDPSEMLNDNNTSKHWIRNKNTFSWCLWDQASLYCSAGTRPLVEPSCYIPAVLRSDYGM